MIQKKSIVIAEHNYLIRKGLLTILHEIANVEVLHEIDNDDAFIRCLTGKKPDIVILNPHFCTLYIQEITARSSAIHNKGVVLGLTNKENPIDQLVCDFDAIIDWEDTRSVLVEKLTCFFENEQSSEDDLTMREKDIVRSIALGLTNKEIGDKLFISPHTVITHRKNITRKLGIKSVSGLTVFAILNNLISVDEVND